MVSPEYGVRTMDSSTPIPRTIYQAVLTADEGVSRYLISSTFPFPLCHPLRIKRSSPIGCSQSGSLRRLDGEGELQDARCLAAIASAAVWLESYMATFAVSRCCTCMLCCGV